jgi:hypothetical protein
MIGSIFGRVATAERMSVDQLKQALENKTLPAYIAIPLIEEKLNMSQRMQGAAAQQPPPPPIAEQVLARANGADNGIAPPEDPTQQMQPMQPPMQQMPQQQPGIEALPAGNMPQDFAGGGIVAFNNQGLVEDEEKRLQEAQAVLEAQQRSRVRGLGGATPRASGRILPNTTGYEGKGLGEILPDIGRRIKDAISLGPTTDYAMRQHEAKNPVPEIEYASVPNPVNYSGEGDTGMPSNPTAVATAAANPFEYTATPITAQTISVPQIKLPPRPGGPSMESTARDVFYGKDGFIARGEARDKELMADLSKNRLQGKAFQDYERALRKEAEEAGMDKDKAKSMALFKAGLAMMSGTSPRALENIGKGAMVGVEDYQAAYKDIRKAEKERQKEFALIEQARRAEERGDLQEARALRIRAADAAERRDGAGTSAIMQARGVDKQTATQEWSTEYAGALTQGQMNLTATTANAQLAQNAAQFNASNANDVAKLNLAVQQLAQQDKRYAALGQQGLARLQQVRLNALKTFEVDIAPILRRELEGLYGKNWQKVPDAQAQYEAKRMLFVFDKTNNDEIMNSEARDARTLLNQ